VAIADFNGDTKPDLALSNGLSPGNTSILLGNGDGTFQTATNIPIGVAPTGIIAKDISGDGKQDLVVSTFSSDIIILKNLSTPGTLAFADKIILPAAQRLNSAAVADLDGDGRPEIIAVTEDAPNIMVFWNISLNGVIAFAPPINIPTGRMPCVPPS